MRNLITRFLRNERGATATEYAMLIVFIALAVATGAQAFSGGLNTWFRAVSTSIATLNANIPQ
jgi:pilus assembly protein Flp/PilA